MACFVARRDRGELKKIEKDRKRRKTITGFSGWWCEGMLPPGNSP
jgi:hypothetical protein